MAGGVLDSALVGTGWCGHALRSLGWAACCDCDGPAAAASLAPPHAVLQVLTEMLDMLRDHQNNSHTARLEWIVIWLIVVEVIVGLFECASILGWVGTH